MRRKHTFINLTNHPSMNWGEEQQSAAREYGELIDYPFPNVDPNEDTGALESLADTVVNDLIKLNPAAVLCQGEFVFCYAIVIRLKAAGVKVLAASSERHVLEAEGRKIVSFNFVKFREY